MSGCGRTGRDDPGGSAEAIPDREARKGTSRIDGREWIRSPDHPGIL